MATKVKGLWIGDGGVATGFARVNHSIINNLPKDVYDIHHIAINYHGDPYECDHKLYPASLGGDLYGIGRIDSFMDKVEPDFVFILNDPWVLYRYLQHFKKYENTKIIAYFPVDAKPLNEKWVERIANHTTPVAYTEFGREAFLDQVPNTDIGVIPHGIDTNTFYPIDMQDARSRLQGIPKDSFIVLSANRNQQRKRLDLTIEGFAKFSRGKPKNVRLYLHCFPGDTPILAPNDVKNIKDVKIGDNVFTHTGETHKVTKIHKRNYTGKLYEIDAVGLPKLRLTSEHPVLAFRSERCDRSRSDVTRCRPWCRAQYKTRNGGRTTRNCSNQYYKEYKEEWLPASELRPGDYVLMPRIKPTDNSMSEDDLQLSRLCGYYVSEGSTNKYAVMFTTYILEEPYHAEIVNSMLDLFDIEIDRYKDYTNKANSVKQQHFLDTEAVKWFNDTCGKGALNKKVPEVIMRGENDLIIEFLKTLWGGDGHYNTSKGFFTYTTFSKTLAYQVQALLTKLGVFSSLRLAKANGEFNGWRVNVWGDSAQYLSRLFCVEYHKENAITRQKGSVQEQYCWRRIKEIKQVDFEGEVFNLTVEKDNSYIAGNTAVHNCGVEDAGWNVIKLCERYGIDDRLLLTSLELSPQAYISDERLNWVYNSSDVGITNSMGEGWGLCVDTDTEILTDSGVTKMRDVTTGNKVLSHTGHFHTVTDKITRIDKTYSLSGRGIPDVITTRQHPFLVIKDRGQPSNTNYKENEARWTSLENIEAGDFVGVPVPNWNESLPEYLDLFDFVKGENIEVDSEHIWNKHGYSGISQEFSISTLMDEFDTTKKVIENARKILSGKFSPRDKNTESNIVAQEIIDKYGDNFELPQPNKVNRFIKVDDDFLEFLGWYLAEGSYSYNKVELSLHEDEIEVAKRFKSYLKSAFGLYATTYKRETGKRSALDCCSSILGELLVALCGTGANTKKLHEILWKAASSLGPLLHGYFKGDGHKSNNGFWSITTVSKQLAWQILYVLRANHIFATFGEYEARGIGNFPQYKVSVGGFEEKLFRSLVQTNHREASRARRQYYIHTENYIFTQVYDVEELKNREVMDISVDGSHSFIGNGVILHNTAFEHGACGRAQIVPENSAPDTIYPDDMVYKLPTHYKYTYPRILTEGQVTTADEIAEAIEFYYTNEDVRLEHAEKLHDYITSDKFKWSTIGNQWHELIQEVLYSNKRFGLVDYA